LAAAIRERFPNAEIEMIPSGGGRFEVVRDGKPIFQKSKLGRHAQPGEILQLLSSEPA
jgi:selT/selW/selH-like putative selenoprotein